MKGNNESLRKHNKLSSTNLGVYDFFYWQMLCLGQVMVLSNIFAKGRSGMRGIATRQHLHTLHVCNNRKGSRNYFSGFQVSHIFLCSK